jgi:NitT/TauT family transport system ATP-binding protein
MQLGFVFQEPTLMPWASVFDNVRLPLRLQGRSAADVSDEVREVLRWVGLDEFEHAYPRELSGGMRMRVSIARALVTRPNLLLLDEPFAALDEITRGRLDDDLKRIWQERALTVVFVTHSVYEAVFLSSRVAVFRGRPGRIVASLDIDTPDERDDAFRESPRYVELCLQASAALRRASET